MGFIFTFSFLFIILGLGLDMVIFYFTLMFLFLLLNLKGNIFSFLINFDFFSSGLILLSLWIGLMMFLSSFLFIDMNYYWFDFKLMILLLIFLLFFCFSYNSFFLFYISFEFVVIPTFLLVLGWGFSVERLQAGLYMFIYTLIASLPFLLFLMFNFNENGSLLFDFVFFVSFKSFGYFWWLFICLVFLVKLPIFLVHLWLPKAHVEAPLSGSMILAGVLLKLGGYGMFKSLNFCLYDFIFFGNYLFSLGLFGSMMISFFCLRQFDLKSLIAYSSISHMGPVLCSIMSMSWLGWMGCYYMLLAHGLCSSGLFYILNLIYERWGSRSILILKGGVFCSPILSFWWFSLCAGNMACPPSFNFLSEFFMVLTIISFDSFSMLMLGLLLLISGFYSVFLFVSFNHGEFQEKTYINVINFRENLILFSHLFPVYFFFICINFMC